MAASDPAVTAAKNRLNKTAGDPDDGWITPSDVQTAFDDLQDGWQSDLRGAHPGVIVVAAANAPADVKAAATYVCSGSGDQTIINAALTAAAAGHNLGSGSGRDTTATGTFGPGRVLLTAGRFFLTGSVLMPTGATLAGVGQATELFAETLAGGPMIALTSPNNTSVTVRDMLLSGDFSSGNAAGIFFDNTGGSFAGVFPPTHPDTIHRVMNVEVVGTLLYGVRNAGGRGDKFVTVAVRDSGGHGFHIGSSDCHLLDCASNPGGSTSDAYYVNGGNTVLSMCKGFYSDRYGFNIQSSRAILTGCTAQDNGTYGFYIAADDCQLTGCVADSNQRLDATGTAGGGVYIGYDQCNITALSVYDRGQSPNKQMQGIVVGATGMDEASVQAYVEVPAGGTEVVGLSNLTPIGNYYQINRGTGDVIPYASPAVGFQPYTTAGRPAAGQYPGHGIWDTDLDAPVFWDGTAWVAVSGGGGLAAQDKTSPPVPITDPTNQQIARIDISRDASDSANWPDRFHFRFESQATPGLFVRTGGFNEKGEIRADAAYINSVPFRVHGYPSYIAGPQTANLLEIKLERAAAGPMFWVDAQGRVFAPAAVTDADQLATDGHVRATAWVQWHGDASEYLALGSKDEGVLYALIEDDPLALAADPLAQTVDVTFDSGVNGQPVATGGAVASVFGSPVYTSAGIHGVGVLMENGDFVEASLVKNGNVFTASAFARVAASIASSAVRVLVVVDGSTNWISYCRFSSNGSIEVTDGTALAQTGPAWSVGTVYRVEVISDASKNLTWRIFDVQGDILWTSTPITPTQQNAASYVRLGSTGGPTTFSLTMDTLRLSSDGTWLGQYGGGMRSLRAGANHVRSGALLSPTGTVAVSEERVAVGGQRVQGVGAPTAASDAATKGYVDGRIWSGTQAAYDAIGTKDSTVLYVIVP